MDRFLTKSPVLAGIAVVLALAVWASVVGQTDPIVTRTFTTLPIQVVGAPPGTTVQVFPKVGSALVNGPSSVLSTLSHSSLGLTVEDPGGRIGKIVTQVHLVAPPGVGLVEGDPQTVTIIVAH